MEKSHRPLKRREQLTGAVTRLSTLGKVPSVSYAVVACQLLSISKSLS
jgi:hypothetical protein